MLPHIIGYCMLWRGVRWHCVALYVIEEIQKAMTEITFAISLGWVFSLTTTKLACIN